MVQSKKLPLTGGNIARLATVPGIHRVEPSNDMLPLWLSVHRRKGSPPLVARWKVTGYSYFSFDRDIEIGRFPALGYAQAANVARNALQPTQALRVAMGKFENDDEAVEQVVDAAAHALEALARLGLVLYEAVDSTAWARELWNELEAHCDNLAEIHAENVRSPQAWHVARMADVRREIEKRRDLVVGKAVRRGRQTDVVQVGHGGDGRLRAALQQIIELADVEVVGNDASLRRTMGYIARAAIG